MRYNFKAHIDFIKACLNGWRDDAMRCAQKTFKIFEL